VRTTGQLPLPFPTGRRLTAADFHEQPSNAAALAWLGQQRDWPHRRLALWGAAGSGKTHLLHIWAARTGAALWHGPALRDLPDLPAAGIALDDAFPIADEAALFHLLNAAGEAGLPVLLAARTPPARWAVGLPDLASRLRAITAVEIGPPEDALLAVLLARLLAERQLRLPDPVHAWLLTRLPRTPAALQEAVSRLDAMSLEASRDITVALARDVLGELIGPQRDEISASAIRAPP